LKVGKTNSYSCVVYTKSCVLKSLNDKFKICASKGRKIGVFFRFLAFGVISFAYREIGERYARYVSSLTNKQTKGRKFEIFASVSYRSNTGKERKKKSRENRWKIANFDNFWLTAVFFTAKVAFWRAWMKNKVTTHQIKEEKLEIFASVSYRSNTGREKKRIWERYNGHFEQIQVKFYQLFATTISLANFFFQNAKKGLKC